MPRPEWTNWAGTVTRSPGSTAHPRDVPEAAALLRAAARSGRTVRPLGSGHSFTAVGAPDDGALALDLARWTGIERVDGPLVTVRAGTPLHRLNRELAEFGLALPNLGDIDQQTIAGAISTGTHGTGAELGGLATQVTALELLLADGSTRRCSETEDRMLFDAARIGLGALGVLTRVTLRCVPEFHLVADERPEPLDEVLDRFEELAAANHHFEFYWFPHSARTLVKRNNRLPAGEAPHPLSRAREFFEYEVVENRAFGALCRLGRASPRMVRPLNRFCAATWSSRHYSDRAHRVFVTRRRVRFLESEYAIPLAELPAALGELRAAAATLDHPVMFPVEVRVAAADDIWLSTAHRRRTAYIAVHQFTGMPHRSWFDAFSSIADAVGGRPHWGKMHRLTADRLRERYPRFDDFRALRAELDPEGLFDNPYLARVLG
ncbi:D-arabinono-1,4-lactone oxidase [Saccharopolyspora sp. MS10]|uniref:D-arabinono-1,4-lactone oxidase n=1 Tax=Saccharopolyspora sp. MS10 TaxID=3385973 RepID=UPI0039A1B3F1